MLTRTLSLDAFIAKLKTDCVLCSSLAATLTKPFKAAGRSATRPQQYADRLVRFTSSFITDGDGGVFSDPSNADAEALARAALNFNAADL